MCPGVAQLITSMDISPSLQVYPYLGGPSHPGFLNPRLRAAPRYPRRITFTFKLTYLGTYQGIHPIHLIKSF